MTTKTTPGSMPITDGAIAAVQKPLEQQVPGVAFTPPSLPTPQPPPSRSTA